MNLSGLFHAVASGDPHAILGALACLALTLCGARVFELLAAKFAAAVDWLLSSWDARTSGRIQAAGDEFLAKVRVAFRGRIHLDAALRDALADGTIAQDELLKLLQAVWADVKDNTGIHTWADIMELLSRGSAVGGPQGAETVAKGQFMVVAKAMAHEIAAQEQSRIRTLAAPVTTYGATERALFRRS